MAKFKHQMAGINMREYAIGIDMVKRVQDKLSATSPLRPCSVGQGLTGIVAQSMWTISGWKVSRSIF